jgi:hypothetical protein
VGLAAGRRNPGGVVDNHAVGSGVRRESCLEGVHDGGDRVVSFVGEELSPFGKRGDEDGDIVDAITDADPPADCCR